MKEILENCEKDKTNVCFFFSAGITSPRMSSPQPGVSGIARDQEVLPSTSPEPNRGDDDSDGMSSPQPGTSGSSRDNEVNQPRSSDNEGEGEESVNMCLCR